MSPVRTDWLATSAALLVTGALALALASVLTPTGSSSADTLRLVQEHDGRWLAAAAIYFLAAVCLILGLPSALTLFNQRGRTVGLVGATVLSVGFIGVAGYAMLLVFFRAMVITDAIRSEAFDRVTHESGLQIFLYGWVIAFYLGELLLAIGLLRAGTIRRWIPVLLLMHAATFPVSQVLPELLAKAVIFLMVFGFAGIGMRAAEPRPTGPA
ncbi:MAG: hypothetical protein JWO11_1570 [Nocardioides sp.]|nr:hypothetical protein [Nocardioides sp.]